MVKTLEQAISEIQRLPAEDQEQIGRTLLSHVEQLHLSRAEIDKGIRSLDAGQGKNRASKISSGKRTGRWATRGARRFGRLRRSTIAKSIWDYYVQVASRPTAEKMLREIAKAIALIEEHPFVGRARNEVRPGLRSFAAAPHVVFYRVVDDTPQIVRLLDGRQDIEEKFAAPENDL